MKRYLIIPLVAIALMAAGCGAANTNTNNTADQSNEDQVINIKSSEDTSAWQTYTNTKYGYTIKYPAGLSLVGADDVGSEAPITPESYRATVSDQSSGNSLVGISAGQSIDFTEEGIKKSYTSELNPLDQIRLAKVSISGLDGYQLFAPVTNEDYNHYYIKLSNGNIVIVNELKDNSQARTILSTLKVK